MDLLVTILIGVLAVASFLLSVYLAIFGNRAGPAVVDKVLDDYLWVIGVPCLPFVIVMTVAWAGQFARSECSPFPWIDFVLEYERHGLGSAIFGALVICTVDLWLLWIPGHLWVTSNLQSARNASTTVRLAVRGINLIIGVTLMWPNNFIYRLAGYCIER